MSLLKNKTFIMLVVVVIIVAGLFVGNQVYTVHKAHSSFDNYYAFRGCVKLLERTSTWATCQIASGQTIKIVEVNNKWYLDGDLPVCYGSLCF